MNDRPLDLWRDRMVTALFGELSAEQRGELDRALANDEELRRDWQELGEARALLDTIRAEEAVPARFELPPETPSRAPVATVSVWRWALASAAGFLFAAVLFGGLLLTGLRVDKTPQGILVGFVRETVLEPQQQPISTHILAQDQQQYLTRDEFMSLARTLVGATAARLDELERRQSSTQTETARLLFQALATRQQRQYDDLRARLQLASLRPAGGVGQGPDIVAPQHNQDFRR